MPSTDAIREKAILIGIDRRGASWPLVSSLAELERLAFTAGADVVGITSQRISHPDPATFVGKGKLAEISQMASDLDADILIFDDELTPTQQSNIERSIPRNIKVIDRTALILDIFALHAKSREGKLQVRLAQNQYLYPRLRGMWSHLASNRMGGGVGSRFGEGESQLEVDRRMVRNRITSIKRELATLSKVRAQQRRKRFRNGGFRISLVGYTNAGKSSLLNALCKADVYSDDLLFATLDSTTRRLNLPGGREATLTDTVGFIQKLPTTLIEAFKSTLDEVAASDLLLHVVDVSDQAYDRQMEEVVSVLGQIESSSIPRIIVFNKSDLLQEQVLDSMKRRYPDAVFVSSHTGEGIDELLEQVTRSASSADRIMELHIPYGREDVLSAVHRRCKLISKEYTETGTDVIARVPDRIRESLRLYEVKAS